MLWFVVWSVLVVATLGVCFLLWRRLYHAARATMVEVDRGAGVFAGLTDQVEALRDGSEPFVVQPGLSHDPVTARARVIELRKERQLRKDRRRRAHSGTHERWDAYGR